MTFQEHEHPRADSGKFENKAQSEAAGVTLAAPLAGASKPKPIMARATLQKWSDFDEDVAETVGTIEFDAAPILAGIVPGLDQRELAGMGLEYDTRDQIFDEAVARGIIPAHAGPFEVDVDDALAEALAENPAYFDTPYPHDEVARHPEAVLQSPLSPYELGARIDENDRIEGLAVIEQDALIGGSLDEHLDYISNTLAGTGVLMDPSATPVSVTPDNQVVYRLSGNASQVIDTMTDAELALFEAGRASRA